MIRGRLSYTRISTTLTDATLVRRRHARITSGLFLRERGAASGRVGSRYDPSLTEADPFPEANFPAYPDPTFAIFAAPVSSAMVDLVTARLNWHPDGPYQLSDERVNRQWQWGDGIERPEALGALRTALAVDPAFRVLIGHGIYDLVTPYLGTKLLLAQIPPDRTGPAATDRLRLILHPAGHMFYTQDDQRAALHDEARALVVGP